MLKLENVTLSTGAVVKPKSKGGVTKYTVDNNYLDDQLNGPIDKVETTTRIDDLIHSALSEVYENNELPQAIYMNNFSIKKLVHELNDRVSCKPFKVEDNYNHMTDTGLKYSAIEIIADVSRDLNEVKVLSNIMDPIVAYTQGKEAWSTSYRKGYKYRKSIR